jgi:hypothetical protein
MEGFAEVRDVITTVTLCSIRQLHAVEADTLAFLTGPRNCSSFVLTRGILLTILQIGTLTTKVSTASELYW